MLGHGLCHALSFHSQTIQHSITNNSCAVEKKLLESKQRLVESKQWLLPSKQRLLAATLFEVPKELLLVWTSTLASRE